MQNEKLWADESERGPDGSPWYVGEKTFSLPSSLLCVNLFRTRIKEVKIINQKANKNRYEIIKKILHNGLFNQLCSEIVGSVCPTQTNADQATGTRGSLMSLWEFFWYEYVWLFLWACKRIDIQKDFAVAVAITCCAFFIRTNQGFLSINFSLSFGLSCKCSDNVCDAP